MFNAVGTVRGGIIAGEDVGRRNLRIGRHDAHERSAGRPGPQQIGTRRLHRRVGRIRLHSDLLRAGTSRAPFMGGSDFCNDVF